MRIGRFLMTLGLFAWLCGGFCACRGESGNPHGDKTTNVPQTVLAEMDSQFRPSARPASRAEWVEMATRQMNKLLELGAQAAKTYPHAENLHEIHLRMLRAAEILIMIRQDEASETKLQEIAGRILASNAPPEVKVHGDFHATRKRIGQMSSAPPEKIDEEILALDGRYEGTGAAASAKMFAARLAIVSGRAKLADQLIEVLKSKHVKDREIFRFLLATGRMPFEADLTRLDGKKLSLPKDLLGKVVVIDFWATWCPPCVDELPNVKRLYARNKPKGLEIVGISLDSSRKELEDFIRDRGMPWIHTCTGLGWHDPTVRAYGVDGIPSMWVVGRDGMILATGLRGETLEGAVAEALKQPAGEEQPGTRPTQPASRPSSR